MDDESQSRMARRKQTGKDIEKLKMAMLLFVFVVLFRWDMSSCKIHSYLVGLVGNVNMLI